MLPAWCLGLWLAGAAQLGGQIGDLDAPRPKQKQFVVCVAESQVVTAGKPAMLELRFRVEDGFHVNSHHPSSELEIPTVVELAPEAGVQLSAAQYPAGKIYTPAFDPSEKLDTYSGEFAVRLPVVATAGSHALHGALKYQACDRAACYPVKTLPVDVLFVAR